MSEEEIKYSIQKVFGRYSICIENGTTVESYFDVQERIIKIIKQLEKENAQLKENNLAMQEEMARTWEKEDKLKSVLKEIREKLKEHKYDLDYEPWNIYKIQGNILFDLLEIIDKGIGE